MPFSATQTAIENFFKTGWGVTTEIEFENDELNPDLYTEYVRFSIQYGDAIPMALGNQYFRYFGVLFVQIFGRPAVGNARALVLADKASVLFRTTSLIAGVNVLVPKVIKFPNAVNGWVQTQVSCDFYFEEYVP